MLDLNNVKKITDPEVIAKDAFDAGWGRTPVLQHACAVCGRGRQLAHLG